MSVISKGVRPLLNLGFTQYRSIHLGPKLRDKNKEVFKNFLNKGSKDIELAPHRYTVAMASDVDKFDTSITPFPDLHLSLDANRVSQSNSQQATKHRLELHPKTILDYWKVAQVMHKKGLVPLVHGQPALWFIPQSILSFLGFNKCQSLRFPDSLKSSSEILEQIDVYQKNPEFIPTILGGLTTHLDHALRDDLLSVTIGLFHYESCESPVSFVFGGGMGTEFSKYDYEGNRSILSNLESRKKANEMIFRAMKEKGFKDEFINDLLKKIVPLYKEAENLKRGQLIVLGVPNHQLSNYAYHCQEFGCPTGLSLQQVLEKLAKSKMPQQGGQARVLISKEFMSSKSGVEVINIMDETSLESFCEGTSVHTPSKEGILSNLMIEWSDPTIFQSIMGLVFDVRRQEKRELEDKNRIEFDAFRKKVNNLIKEIHPKKI